VASYLERYLQTLSSDLFGEPLQHIANEFKYAALTAITADRPEISSNYLAAVSAGPKEKSYPLG
jgi:hypothetical protein